MDFPVLSSQERMELLTPPERKSGETVSTVIDTDTYNEIDDQFAVVHALLSREALDVQAIYAAPFFNKRSSGPGNGMELSYEEILRLLERLESAANLSRSIRPEGFVFKGSTDYLKQSDRYQDSDAARDLVKKAMSNRNPPLYVATIGAITNVASAILMEPEIIKRIVVVWLGGHALYWPTAEEFNLRQDIHASRLIFDCGVPLVQIPCKPVTSHLHTTVPEMVENVAGKGPIGDYLVSIFRGYSDNHAGWSKVIWDVSSTAWLTNPKWVPTVLRHSPILTDQITWSHDPGRHFIRTATEVNRDAIFRDFFAKLERIA